MGKVGDGSRRFASERWFRFWGNVLICDTRRFLRGDSVILVLLS